MTLTDLRRQFVTDFGIPFELLPLPAESDLRLPDRLGGWLFTTVPDARVPLLQSQTLRFPETSRPGDCVVGYWGHGANSHAFYYARNDGGSAVCFRLPFGGVYTDNAAAAEGIGEFLPAFVLFLARARLCGARVSAVESMGAGRYEVAYADGRRVTHTGSLLGRTRFEELE